MGCGCGLGGETIHDERGVGKRGGLRDRHTAEAKGVHARGEAMGTTRLGVGRRAERRGRSQTGTQRHATTG